MADRVTLNVSLTPELGKFIASRVESGRYLSASEVVREGLRLLEDREQTRMAALATLQEKIEAGLTSLKQGKGIAGEEVFAKLEGRLAHLLSEAQAE